MPGAEFQPRAGDWVDVRGFEDIAATLDETGALDGLPFMPEMRQFCGRRFRVLRRAEKTCVELDRLQYRMRAFHGNDVVLLDMPRCSGADHDGCGRACALFWKSRWLRPGGPAPETSGASGDPADLARHTRTADGRYRCQSTELRQATRPTTRPEIVWKCFVDVWSGNRGFREMVPLVVGPFVRHFLGRFYYRPVAVGTLERTPAGGISVQPGERARVRSEAQVLETLDAHARNRGLVFDRGMRDLCGREFRVRSRLERMIVEPTGRMLTLTPTVILEDVTCGCGYHVGGCPRGEYTYWRDIWLEPVGDAHGAARGPS